MSKKLILFLFLLSFLIGSVNAQVAYPYFLSGKQVYTSGTPTIRMAWTADPRDLATNNLVVGLGSSTMYGSGSSNIATTSWFAKLYAYLNTLGTGLQINNYAVPGQDARYWQSLGDNSLVDVNHNVTVALKTLWGSSTRRFPTIAIISDASNFVGNGISNAQEVTNLWKIMRQFLEHGTTVILISPQPRTGYTVPQRQQLKDMADLLQTTYGSGQVPGLYYVNMFPTLENTADHTIKTIYSYGDDIHVNDAGHDAIYLGVKAAIDAAFLVPANINHHELQSSDTKTGPWTNYDVTINANYGYVQLPIVQGKKFFRHRTVYNNSTFTNWSNIKAPVCIQFKPEFVRDFSGYWQDELGGGNSPLNMFDQFSTHDPKNNGMSLSDNAGFSTTPWPFRGSGYHLYGTDGFGNRWRGNRGIRLLFDFSNAYDMFQMAKIDITDIYGLQQGDDGTDSMFFYNADTLFQVPVEQRPMMLARPDSLLKPFAFLAPYHPTIGYTPTWNAVNGLLDSSRYVLVRAIEQNRGSYYSMAPIHELVFYGSVRYDDDTVPVRPKSITYTGPKPKRTTLGLSMGANDYGVSQYQGRFDFTNRYYQIWKQYSRDTTAYPNNLFAKNSSNVPLIGGFDGWYPYQAQGRLAVNSVTGTTQRMENAGANVAQSLNVTEKGMEPEDPNSWLLDADLYRHYAALYMDTTKKGIGITVNSGLRFETDSYLPGLSYHFYKGIENGNEDEAKSLTMIAGVVKAIVEYDKWEHRLGPVGFHDVDTTGLFIQGGQVYATDTNRIGAIIWLMRLFRTDRKIIFTHFNGHHYPSTLNHFPYSPTYDQMVNQGGESPERDHIYLRMKHTMDYLYTDLKGDTTIKWMLSEYGYENFAHRPQTTSEVAYGNPWGVLWSYRTTPIIPGYDSCQSKGILMIRGESMLCGINGLRAFHEFSLTNPLYNPSNSTPALNGTTGRCGHDYLLGGSNPDVNVKFPNYWSTASFRTLMRDYVVDTVYSIDSVGLCHVKWRNVFQPDSVVHEVWKGTMTGSTLLAQPIAVGPTVGNANKKSISFLSETASSTSQTITSGSMVVTVQEEPKFYFMKETTGITPPSDFFIKNKGKFLFFKH